MSAGVRNSYVCSGLFYMISTAWMNQHRIKKFITNMWVSALESSREHFIISIIQLILGRDFLTSWKVQKKIRLIYCYRCGRKSSVQQKKTCESVTRDTCRYLIGLPPINYRDALKLDVVVRCFCPRAHSMSQKST